ncbi:hypothetical protein D9758_014290 [Tetrapyrgos nigripes]|uniref:Uncharacterized protein n=1 Tax=Tetrapyrgos nigripes TaxID=182062 RepID=A0A8H5FF44_9AGAR|nr:hypothetical protein D9758_014290 [Tetrapyrgos nigripes]
MNMELPLKRALLADSRPKLETGNWKDFHYHHLYHSTPHFIPCLKMKLPDFDAWVTADDVPLAEYKITMAEKKVSCWIPSEVGKVKRPLMRNFASYMYLDGQLEYARAVIIDANGTSEIYNLSGLLVSETSERPFVFQSAESTDDDAYLAHEANLGEIKVIIKEVIIGAAIPVPKPTFVPQAKIHERSNKAIKHQIGLGAVETIPIQDYFALEVVRDIGTYVFRYRPIDFLRANSVVPPLPLHSETKKSASPDGPSTFQKQAMIQLAALRKKTVKRIKQEPKDAIIPSQSALRLLHPSGLTTNGSVQAVQVTFPPPRDVQAMPFEAIIPSSGPIVNVPIAEFAEQFKNDVDEEIITKLVGSGYKKIRTLRRLTTEKLQRMGLSDGQVDTLLDAVGDFVEGYDDINYHVE